MTASPLFYVKLQTVRSGLPQLIYDLRETQKHIEFLRAMIPHYKSSPRTMQVEFNRALEKASSLMKRHTSLIQHVDDVFNQAPRRPPRERRLGQFDPHIDLSSIRADVNLATRLVSKLDESLQSFKSDVDKIMKSSGLYGDAAASGTGVETMLGFINTLFEIVRMARARLFR